MPRVTIYISEEDMSLWKELDNKSQWVHEQLTGESFISSNELDRIVKQRVREELDKRERQYG